MPTDLIRMHAVVSGRVQGVGFRYFACDAAMESGVSGWVRNIPGGAVELEAQGRRGDVDAFMEEIRQGPAMSNVVSVNVTETPVMPGEAEFDVRY